MSGFFNDIPFHRCVVCPLAIRPFFTAGSAVASAALRTACVTAAACFAIATTALSLPAQDRVDLPSLRSTCIPTAPLTTLAAIVQTESGGNPFALAIGFPNELLKRWNLAPGALRLTRQPRSALEAAAWLVYFRAHSIHVDAGLMQVSTAEAERRKIPIRLLLDPCANLKIGWAILQDDYELEAKRFGPGQEALRHAISRYNTGDPGKGLTNGYYQRVIFARSHPNQWPENNSKRP